MIVATYNVRGCRGLDGRVDPERVAAVIGELGADVVGVQEIDPESMVRLARATGLIAVAGPTRLTAAGTGGNALLTRHPIVTVRRHDLSVDGREPRGALDVDLDVVGRTCRVVVTHLGLRGGERRRQVGRLLDVLGESAPATGALTIVLADLNEWLATGRALRALRGDLGRGVRSFPARMPLLALDRILVRPAIALARVHAHTSTLARVASDHLPVIGTIRGWSA